MFLNGSLPCLTKLNLSFQRADFFIHVLYDLLHSTVYYVLMSRFMLPEFVRDFRKEKSSKQKILEIEENSDNYLNKENVFFSNYG